jgi:hypothetical protein
MATYLTTLAAIVTLAFSVGCAVQAPPSSTAHPATIAGPATQDANLQEMIAHEKWIEQVLADIGTIKVGMTRRDVLKLFNTDGGMYTRTQQAFIYKQCGAIKNVCTFKPAPDSLSESPDDVITQVSSPFLARPIGD